MNTRYLFLVITTFITLNAFSQKKTAAKSASTKITNSSNKVKVSEGPIYDNVKSLPKNEEITKTDQTTEEDKIIQIIDNNISEIEIIEQTIQKKKDAIKLNQKNPQTNFNELDQTRSKMLTDLLGEKVFLYYNSKYKSKN